MPICRRISLTATVLACLAGTGIASADTTQENLTKYWHARERMLTEFTVRGTGPGQGQPAVERNGIHGFIKWADSTIRLGWYLGILATEYHLLTEPATFPGAHAGNVGRATQTVEELYEALTALERLDLVADASFPPPCSSAPALNGFFLRDDVPDGFHQYFPPMTSTQSDFIDPVLTNKEMSQDQVYHVLLGLALVKRFIPDTLTHQSKGLRQWAVVQATRIGEHISRTEWVIRNPACEDRAVNRGPLASGYSGGTRLTLGFITDGAFVPDTVEPLLNAWELAKDPNFLPYIDEDNLHMAMAIAATGNGWGSETADALGVLAQKEDWPLYPLLHRALFADEAEGFCRTGAALNARARAMLDEVPQQADFASPKPAGPAVHGFSSSNRFIRGKDSAYAGEPNSEGMRYNGQDFMLLHNLYAVATPATWEGGNGPGIPDCAAGGGPGNGAGPADAAHDSSCSCRLGAVPTPGGGAAWLAVLGAAFALHRRTRRQQR